MWFCFMLSLFSLVKLSSSQSCPAEYKRFTLKHTFCIRRNPRCDIKRVGVSHKDIQNILRLHNEYRNKVALGNERGAIGGILPKAADMLEMVWDDELAIIAQKWTENCDFNHDCNECHAVDNFGVGQNLALQKVSCQGYGCREDTLIEPNWEKAVKDLYNEVSIYHKDWLSSYEDSSGYMIGHFTQIIWSTSWRIGCGYTAFKEKNVYKRFYACNYGPAGNSKKWPVYKEGPPCSACPVNSCCGSLCRGGHSYPGLCKILDPNTPPEYRRSSNLFFCEASRKDKDCQVFVSGVKKWRNVKSVGGNYDSIILTGGETTTLSFNSPIVPTKNSFCLIVKFRKGPLQASRGDQSSFRADFKMEYTFASPMDLHTGTTTFKDYNINLQWGSKTKLGFTFSVPTGAGQHILDIREISAYDGPCDSLSK